MSKRRAIRCCPYCSGSMEIIFVDGRGTEVPSVSGAVKSIWRCTVCGGLADHQ